MGKIKKGQTFLCTKNYIMDDNETIAYKKGELYTATKKNTLPSLFDPTHVMDTSDDFYDHFEKVYKKKAEDIKVVYDIVPSARIIEGPGYSIHPPATFGREKTDPIVDSVIKQFRDRSRAGIKKYGTTLQDNNLTTLEWLQHFQEELCDAILYVEKLKKSYEQ